MTYEGTAGVIGRFENSSGYNLLPMQQYKSFDSLTTNIWQAMKGIQNIWIRFTHEFLTSSLVHIITPVFFNIIRGVILLVIIVTKQYRDSLFSTHGG